MNTFFNNLGVRIDGWADTVEGTGSKADEAMKVVSEIMKARNMPSVEIDGTKISGSAFSQKQRPYLVSKMNNGSSITVYIGAFGNDLFASWDLYIRPVFNWRTLGLLFGTALLLNGPCALLTGMGGTLGALSQSSPYGNGPALGAAAGSLLSTLCFAVIGTAVTFVFLAVLVATAGVILRGSPFAFFFKDLDEFDSDDVSALALTTHKCVLHALDKVGINLQALRLKEQFRTGSRGSRLI